MSLFLRIKGPINVRREVSRQNNNAELKFNHSLMCTLFGLVAYNCECKNVPSPFLEMPDERSWEKPRSQGPLLLGEVELETECLFKVKRLNLSFIEQFLYCSGASKICKKEK